MSRPSFGWVTQREFRDGLAFSQLAPGPLAAQLAMYLRWLCVAAGIVGVAVKGLT